MRKKELLKLRKLRATDKMLEMAAKDKEKIENCGWGYKRQSFKYGIYLRCQCLQGIVKVAMFFAKDLKKGLREPVYEIFLNPKSGDFCTYKVQEQKWSNAKIDMLDRPSYTWNSGKWMNPEGTSTIKSELKQDRGGYAGILAWQQDIRRDELKQRHRRETSAWDVDMEQVPALPKDWDTWINGKGCKYNYIFYKYDRKGAKEGYCTSCKKSVPVKNPKHNKTGKCTTCRREVQFKTIDKAGNFYSEDWTRYLIQKCDDGAVIRQFRCRLHFYKGKYEQTKVDCWEEYRCLIDEAFHQTVYHYEDYKNTGMRWCKTSPFYSYKTTYKGMTYQRTLPTLEKGILQRTGIGNIIRAGIEIDPINYMEIHRRYPSLEKLAKGMLEHLAAEVADKYCFYNSPKMIMNEKRLHNILGISKEALRIMQKEKLGYHALTALRIGEKISVENLKEFDRYSLKIGPDNTLGKLWKRTDLSLNKLINYLRRQAEKDGLDIKQEITFYRDYLDMAERRGMDIRDDIVRLQPNMRKYHDRYLEEENQKKNQKRYQEVNKKFPKIKCQAKQNQGFFGWEHGDMIIMVPERAEDIVKEGQLQHHCVGANDNYISSMNEGRSFILFLRKKEDLDRPYYTIEATREGSIKQYYAAYDRQPEKEKVKAWLDLWTKEVVKRKKKLEKEAKKETRLQAAV